MPSPTVRPPLSQPYRLTRAALPTLLAWHARYAVNPSSLAALRTATQVLTIPDVPGGLILQRVGGVWVVSGEPLAPASAWPALSAALLALATRARVTPCFAPIGAEFAGVLSRQGLQTVRVGSTPYVHLQHWPQAGRRGARVREAVNRAAREGLSFREVRPVADGEEPGQHLYAGEVERLLGEWHSRHRSALAFHWIFDPQPLRYAERKRYFEARQGGRLTGLIAASPLHGRDCWYLEDVLRATQAPTVTVTSLVSFALDTLKADGVLRATLGGLPLARERGWDEHEISALERLAYLLRPVMASHYGFDGLETFKRHFGPAHWENEFIAFPAGARTTVKVGAALLRLILTDTTPSDPYRQSQGGQRDRSGLSRCPPAVLGADLGE